MSWSARIAHTSTGLAIVFAGPALLGIGGCKRELSGAFEGGRVGASFSAERCPPALTSAIAPQVRPPRTIATECREYSPQEFTIFTRFKIDVPPVDSASNLSRDEIWRVSCLRNQCNAATLDARALDRDAPLERFELRPTQGTVVSRAGRIVTMRFEAVGELTVVADLDGGPVTYKHKFKSGAMERGVGDCIRKDGGI